MDSIGEKSRSLNLFSLNVGALAQFLKSVRKEASQVVPVVNHTPANAGDVRDAGSIPGLGRSPGGGNGNPPQYSWQRILWTEELGRLQSMGLQRVGHD